MNRIAALYDKYFFEKFKVQKDDVISIFESFKNALSIENYDEYEDKELVALIVKVLGMIIVFNTILEKGLNESDNSLVDILEDHYKRNIM